MINWPGLFGAATLAFVLFLSLAYRAPWWQLVIADELGHVSVSPLDAEIRLLGSTIDIPLLWYVNLGAKLTMLLVAASLLVYSLNTGKSYSRKLLDACYRKPVYMVLSIILLCVVTRLLVGSLFNFDIPLVGASRVAISSNGVTISVPITASFQWVFWLALLSALLAISAKVYHHRFIGGEKI